MTWVEWSHNVEKSIQELDRLGKGDVILRLVEGKQYDEALKELRLIHRWVDNNVLENGMWDHIYDEVEWLAEQIEAFRQRRTD